MFPCLLVRQGLYGGKVPLFWGSWACAQGQTGLPGAKSHWVALLAVPGCIQPTGWSCLLFTCIFLSIMFLLQRNTWKYAMSVHIRKHPQIVWKKCFPKSQSQIIFAIFKSSENMISTTINGRTLFQLQWSNYKCQAQYNKIHKARCMFYYEHTHTHTNN